MKYDKDSLTVQTVAALMGCKPDSGLVNRLNALDAATNLKGLTYGQIYRAVLLSMLTEELTQN